MDVNSSDQNGKPSINLPTEEPKESKENRNELPVGLHAKFPRKVEKKGRRLKRKSRETQSRDDDTQDKGSEDKDEEKEEEKDGGGREHKERETEEPECRESETSIVVVAHQNSPTDVKIHPNPQVSMDMDEKPRKTEEKRKKKDTDSLDEAEKKNKKNNSRRKKKKKKKKDSGRNSQRNSQRKSLEEGRKKRKPSKEHPSKESIPSPKQSGIQPLKTEKSTEQVAARKSRANQKTADLKAPDKKGQPAPPPQKNKFNTFFKVILDKTKLWMRKSDDVAQPTKEMLIKSYVSPEYGFPNSNDYQPDPSSYMSSIELDARLKNSKCGDVFLNNRPFWVHRTNEDVIPKCKLLSHSVLLTQQKAGTFCSKELPKRTFYDPKRESLEKLKAIDALIGADDPTKEKELKRITSNTFFGTCQMQAYKFTAEGKKKLDEFESKYGASPDDKKTENKGTVVFLQIEKKEDPMEKPVLVLNSYVRKARPYPGKIREFKTMNYVSLEQGKKLSKNKETGPSPSQESQNIPNKS